MSTSELQVSLWLITMVGMHDLFMALYLSKESPNFSDISYLDTCLVAYVLPLLVWGPGIPPWALIGLHHWLYPMASLILGSVSLLGFRHYAAPHFLSPGRMHSGSTLASPGSMAVAATL